MHVTFAKYFKMNQAQTCSSCSCRLTGECRSWWTGVHHSLSHNSLLSHQSLGLWHLCWLTCLEMYVQPFSGNISGTTHTNKTPGNTAQLLLISASEAGSSTASHSLLPLPLWAAHRALSITTALSPSAEHEKLLGVPRFSKHARHLPAHTNL